MLIFFYKFDLKNLKNLYQKLKFILKLILIYNSSISTTPLYCIILQFFKPIFTT